MVHGFLNGLEFAAVFAAVYYVPGRLIVDRWLASPGPQERFPLSLGIGLVLVNTLVLLWVGVTGLFTHVEMTPAHVLTVALGISAPLLAYRGWKEGFSVRDLLPTRPDRTTLALGALSLVACCTFLVLYDEDGVREDCCNLRTTVTAIEDFWERDVTRLLKTEGGIAPLHEDINGDGRIGLHPRGGTALLAGWEGQQLGPATILAPFAVLFGSFGLRMAYALQGLLLPGLGFLLGWHVLGRRRAAWCMAAPPTLNGYSLEIRIFDENIFSNVFGSLALVFLLRKHPAPGLAGLATGLFLANRHVEVVVVPVVLYYLWRHAHAGRRAILPFLTALLVSLAPEIVMHGLTGGLFESTFDRTAVPHSFLGMSFDSAMLLNYPFITELLRSPYHAFPTLVAFPLDLVRRFGVVLLSLIPAGILFLSRTDRRAFWLLAAWFVPLLAGLMVQSNWVEQNKMGVPATALAPFLLVVVAGVEMLLDQRSRLRSRLAWVATGAVIVMAGVPMLRAVDTAVDARVLTHDEESLDPVLAGDTVIREEETPAYVAWDRDRYAHRFLPRFLPDHEWHPRIVLSDARRAVDHLRHPEFVDFRRSVVDFVRQCVEIHEFSVNTLSLRRVLDGGQPSPGIAPIPLDPQRPEPASPGDMEAGARIPVVLDLRAPPLLAPAPLSAPRDASAPRIGLRSAVTVVPGLQVDWAPNAGMSLILVRASYDRTFVFLAPGRVTREQFPTWLDVDFVSAEALPDLRVTILVSSGQPIRMIEFRSHGPRRWYSRFGVVEQDSIWLSSAVPLSPT